MYGHLIIVSVCQKELAMLMQQSGDFSVAYKLSTVTYTIHAAFTVYNYIW